MKAVVFDMDGVIFDTERLILSSWEKVGKEYKISNAGETCRKCFGTTNDVSREIFKEKYGQDFNYDYYKEFVREYFSNHLKTYGIPLKTGVIEILKYLKENEFKIGLASSTRLQIVEEELEMAGIEAYFDNIVGGDLLKHSKPKPDIYLMACKNLAIEPSAAYAIEDSYNGIRSAHAANMKPIMVIDMLEPTEEMRTKTITVKNDLLEVIDFINTAKKQNK